MHRSLELCICDSSSLSAASKLALHDLTYDSAKREGLPLFDHHILDDKQYHKWPLSRVAIFELL